MNCARGTGLIRLTTMSKKDTQSTNGHESARINPKHDNVVFKDLSFRIMSAVFEVHNTLGPGFLENVYEKALLQELRLREVEAENQKDIKVNYKGQEVGSYYADILVEKQIILELKAVDKLSGHHESQVLNYLKATGLPLGILINFGSPHVEHKRFVL